MSLSIEQEKYLGKTTPGSYFYLSLLKHIQTESQVLKPYQQETHLCSSDFSDRHQWTQHDREQIPKGVFHKAVKKRILTLLKKKLKQNTTTKKTPTKQQTNKNSQKKT